MRVAVWTLRLAVPRLGIPRPDSASRALIAFLCALVSGLKSSAPGSSAGVPRVSLPAFAPPLFLSLSLAPAMGFLVLAA